MIKQYKRQWTKDDVKELNRIQTFSRHERQTSSIVLNTIEAAPLAEFNAWKQVAAVWLNSIDPKVTAKKTCDWKEYSYFNDICID